MKIKCSNCDGNGYVQNVNYQTIRCPTCSGLGQIEIDIIRNNVSDCKRCYGTGRIQRTIVSTNKSEKIKCDICNGVGKIIVPKPEFNIKHPQIIPVMPTRRQTSPQNEYDIAVSFAGQNRNIVETYCMKLNERDPRVRIFYDNHEKHSLWGKNLYTHLDDIYRNKARYCVMFVSIYYKNELWTNHERESAQVRAFREHKEYILPVRIDDTEIPGLKETIGYIDLRTTSLDELVVVTLNKIHS